MLALRLTAESLRLDARRTLTTLLGVAVGTASVCLTIGVAESLTSSSDAFYDELQPNVLTVGPDPTVRAAHLDASDVEGVRVLAPVDAAAATSATVAVVAAGDERRVANVVGTDPDYFLIYDLPLREGRPLVEADAGRPVCVVGSALGDLLGARRSVRIGAVSCSVVGVLDEAGLPARDGAVFTDRASLGRLTGAAAADVQLHVALDPAADLDDAEGAIVSAVRTARGTRAEDVAGLEVVTPAAVREETRRLRLGVFWAGLFVTGLAVVVSMIGVSNVMFATAEARVFEIGVRRAVGATTRGVVGQLLVEAGLLGLAGGALGVAVAVSSGGAFGLIVPLGAAVVVVAASVAGGVGAGLAPALRAGRVHPVEALRLGEATVG